MRVKKTIFAPVIIRWQKQYGRHDLPWQCDDSYKVWLSEIMLQQTQVTAVIPYYQKFLRRFPDVYCLARARIDSVMAVWSGLGYYARARHLHAAAKIIARDGFPETVDGWQALPGVGRSTAAAINIFTNGGKQAILDGNVKRVLARAFAIEKPINQSTVIDELWTLADSLLPERNIAIYTQGLMDLGSMVCVRRRPRCNACPLMTSCLAHQRGLEQKLPLRRRSAAKPTRAITMMLIGYQNTVLLYKRPVTGIWGGLWSLPEATTMTAQNDSCQQYGNLLTLQGETAFTHTFTHYRLQARVLIYNSQQPYFASGSQWFKSKALADAPLPAPIKKLLLHFFAQQ